VVVDSAGTTLAVEENLDLLDQDPLVVPGTTIAEACVSLIRAPGSLVPRFIKRRPLPDRSVAGTIQERGQSQHPGVLC
jgi:hypothetical protein